MGIVIRSRNVDMTPVLRDYIYAKMFKIQPHAPVSGHPRMTIKLEKRCFQVKLTLLYLPKISIQYLQTPTSTHRLTPLFAQLIDKSINTSSRHQEILYAN